MYAMFPVEWRFGDNPTDGLGGPAVDDAGTIYIVRDEDVQASDALAAALRAAADMLDAGKRPNARVKPRREAASHGTNC